MALILLTTFLSLVVAVSAFHKKFTIHDCQSCAQDDSQPVQFTSVSLSPQVIAVGDTFYLNVGVSSTITLDSSISVKTGLYRNLGWGGGKIALPCVNNVGSCYWDNFCDFLTFLNNNMVNRHGIHTYVGIPGSCPVESGDFSISNERVTIPNIGWLGDMFEQGDYTLTISLMQGGTTVGCLTVYFEVQTSY